MLLLFFQSVLTVSCLRLDANAFKGYRPSLACSQVLLNAKVHCVVQASFKIRQVL